MRHHRTRDEILKHLGEAPEAADLDAADEILGDAALQAYGVAALRARVDTLEAKLAAAREYGESMTKTAIDAGNEARDRVEELERERDRLIDALRKAEPHIPWQLLRFHREVIALIHGLDGEDKHED